MKQHVSTVLTDIQTDETIPNRDACLWNLFDKKIADRQVQEMSNTAVKRERV